MARAATATAIPDVTIADEDPIYHHGWFNNGNRTNNDDDDSSDCSEANHDNDARCSGETACDDERV